jgi:hypothetical protein
MGNINLSKRTLVSFLTPVFSFLCALGSITVLNWNLPNETAKILQDNLSFKLGASVLVLLIALSLVLLYQQKKDIWNINYACTLLLCISLVFMYFSYTTYPNIGKIEGAEEFFLNLLSIDLSFLWTGIWGWFLFTR